MQASYLLHYVSCIHVLIAFLLGSVCGLGPVLSGLVRSWLQCVLACLSPKQIFLNVALFPAVDATTFAGSLLTLQGAGAYDAAVHCASVSAARRLLQQQHYGVADSSLQPRSPLGYRCGCSGTGSSAPLFARQPNSLSIPHDGMVQYGSHQGHTPPCRCLPGANATAHVPVLSESQLASGASPMNRLPLAPQIHTILGFQELRRRSNRVIVSPQWSCADGRPAPAPGKWRGPRLCRRSPCLPAAGRCRSAPRPTAVRRSGCRAVWPASCAASTSH